MNLSGNARSGKVLDVITRGDRVFHVYAGESAADKVVVEVKPKTAGADAGTTTASGSEASSGGHATS